MRVSLCVCVRLSVCARVVCLFVCLFSVCLFVPHIAESYRGSSSLERDLRI